MATRPHRKSPRHPTRAPLTRLMFDLIIEPLIRWLNASQKGDGINSCGLYLASKWYVDDGTLVTNTIDAMITLRCLLASTARS